MFNRRSKSHLPELPKFNSSINKDNNTNNHVFKVGENVRIYLGRNSKNDGKIIKVRKLGQSFEIMLNDNRKFTRNKKFLRKYHGNKYYEKPDIINDNQALIRDNEALISDKDIPMIDNNPDTSASNSGNPIDNSKESPKGNSIDSKLNTKEYSKEKKSNLKIKSVRDSDIISDEDRILFANTYLNGKTTDSKK